MPSPLLALIADRIRAHGPMPVAEYVELALYHPGHGYYATAERRSGRAGDFMTSVDVGPVFGELLGVQIAEMLDAVGGPAVDLVEAAAGSGRLSRDILDHLERASPRQYAAVRLHLVERSGTARASQASTLGRHAALLATSGPSLPRGVRGVIVANELLDALPPHLVVMRDGGLREVAIGLGGSALVPVEVEPTTPAIPEYLHRVGAQLRAGQYAEVNLAAAEWIRQAASALEEGFLLLLDYGHEAGELYGDSHPAGTLTTFKRHAVEDRAGGPGWLREPGGRDITSHVDFTGVRLAAESAGLETLGLVDQTYFLLALSEGIDPVEAHDERSLGRRLALKTLLLPGGLGSTHKVLVFGRRVGRPRLKGLAAGGRLT
ncbi:MAG TPA: SAM-dependent methyltransferase [Vicinamibacterales bacterium]|nr:SAM-dependent methyltransferase [Vicinamibacterales bacterium]